MLDCPIDFATATTLKWRGGVKENKDVRDRKILFNKRSVSTLFARDCRGVFLGEEKARRGEERRGEERRGEARRGEARRGEARERERECVCVCVCVCVSA